MQMYRPRRKSRSAILCINFWAKAATSLFHKYYKIDDWLMTDDSFVD